MEVVLDVIETVGPYLLIYAAAVYLHEKGEM